MEFVDLDDLIEKMDGRTVPEIFTQDGEDIFREKEKNALQSTANIENAVISTGGGAPRFSNNMGFMKDHGITIYLKLDENTLVGRLKKASKDRPVVKGKTPEQIREYVAGLLEKYEHIYLSAEYVVDAKNLAPDELVSDILGKYSA